VSVFRRRKKDGDEGAAPAAAQGDEGFVDDLDADDREYEDGLLLAEIEAAEARPVPPRPQGPWDAADAPEDDVPRIDLGGLLVPVPADAEVRVDVSPEGEVVAATLVTAGGAVQVNAFAAPRTQGIWSEVLDEIAESLHSSGGQAERVDGVHGPELHTTVPTQTPDGQGAVMTPARFVGVDGPRWFLRALYTGAAAVDPASAALLEQAVRDVVVVRGSDPMAVRDPIPLRLPPGAQAPAPGQLDVVDAVDAAGADGADADPLALPERGPEITETR